MISFKYLQLMIAGNNTSLKVVVTLRLPMSTTRAVLGAVEGHRSPQLCGRHLGGLCHGQGPLPRKHTMMRKVNKAFHPIGSMGLVYLPTFGWFLIMVHVGKYTIHGSYGPCAMWLSMTILYCGYKLMISNCRTDKLLLSFFRFERRANLLYSTVYVHMHLHATASINPIYCLFRHTSVPFSDLWVAHKVSKKRRPGGSKYGSKRQELLIGSWQTPRSSLKIRLSL